MIDPEARIALHHDRRGGLLVLREELTDGTRRLDPPGIGVPIAEMLIAEQSQA